MPERIPSVSFELLKKAVEAANDNRQAGPTLAVIMALSDEYSSDELSAVTYRLQALAHVVADKKADHWTVHVAGKEYSLISEALFKAAARAPLTIEPDQLVGDIAFDPPTLLQIALEDSETGGKA